MARDVLRDRGITWNISSTNYYQGVTTGGVRDDFRFGGRADIYLNVDGQKAGLWEGLSVTLHDETLYGQSVNGFTGALSPVSIGQTLPVPNGPVNALTGVKVTQALSERVVAFAGKINTGDEFNQPFTGGVRGVDGFMNLALCVNPSLARTVPYSTLGGGAAYLVDKQPVASVLVFDTANTPLTSGFERFFQNGATVVGQVNLPTQLLGRPGHQGFGFSYSSGKYTELDNFAYIQFQNISQGMPARGRETGSWALFYAFDQTLGTVAGDPKRAWGVFGNTGITDGNPNPIRWSANIGLGGASPLAGRPLDTFGVGYFYLGVSDSVKNFAPGLLPIRAEHGVELFYNAGVTPWFHVTPDFQVVTPAQDRVQTSVIVGVRAKIDF